MCEHPQLTIRHVERAVRETFDEYDVALRRNVGVVNHSGVSSQAAGGHHVQFTVHDVRAARLFENDDLALTIDGYRGWLIARWVSESYTVEVPCQAPHESAVELTVETKLSTKHEPIRRMCEQMSDTLEWTD